MHTSAKARVTSVATSVQPSAESLSSSLIITTAAIWRISMNQWLDSLSVSPNCDESGKQYLYPDDDPDHDQNLIVSSIIGPLPTFPENSMQIRLEFFCAKMLTKNKQTYNDDYIIILLVLGGGNFISIYSATWTVHETYCGTEVDDDSTFSRYR